MHEAAGNRTQRHHERVDAHVDRPPAAGDGELDVLAHAEDDVGRDLTLPEQRHGPLPRVEVPLDPGPCLARSHPGEHLRV
ncbi:MAG: hypothetical protein ACRDVG_13205, partial [Jatrophihabitantaceae bacterium]